MSGRSEAAFVNAGGCACVSRQGRSLLSPQRRARALPAGCRQARYITHASLAPPGDDHSGEYWANVGSVIDGLRVDYPRLPFVEPNLAEYAENVTLRARAGLLCQGRAAYRGVLWLFRAQLRLCFATRSVAVHGFYHDAKEGQVFVRWRLTGVPRMGMSNDSFVYDGLSVYTLNDQGMICDHLVENIVRLRAPLRPLFERVLSGNVGTIRGARGGVPAGAGVPTWCALRKGEFVPLPQELQMDDATLCDEDVARTREKDGSDGGTNEGEELGLGMSLIGTLAASL